jgi:hypothetical protein
MTYQKILKALEKAVKKFNRSIPAAQRSIFDAITEQVNKLDLYPDGKIRPTVRNLSILNSIRNKINRVVLTDEYKNDVKEFAKAFNDITKLQNEYWKSVESTFKPRPLLKEIRKQAITDVVGKLTEAGIGANVSDRIIDILRTNITTGGSYKSLTSQLRDGLLNTEQKGYLDRYAKQVTTDSLNQYNAQYSQIVSSDLGYSWFKYDNTLIETSRPFCQSMREENEYFHISQVPALLRAEGLYYDDEGVRKKVQINPKTNLPDGFIPGTNPENFFVRRAGYNCMHQIRPVSERQVPAEILAKIVSLPEYKRWVSLNSK